MSSLGHRTHTRVPTIPPHPTRSSEETSFATWAGLPWPWPKDRKRIRERNNDSEHHMHVIWKILSKLERFKFSKKEREKLKWELRGCGLRTFQACQSLRTLAKILGTLKKYHSKLIISNLKMSSHFSQDLSQAVLMMHWKPMASVCRHTMDGHSLAIIVINTWKHLYTKTFVIKSSGKRWKLQTTTFFTTWQMTCLPFKILNTLYSVVHKQISPAKPIASNDMEDLQHSIDRYMAFFRSNFPTVSILPKQHILECHCVDFIRNWGFGLGLHGEQGGEETHAAINQLKRRTWGLKERQTSFVFWHRNKWHWLHPVYSQPFLLPLKRKSSIHACACASTLLV